MFLIFQSSANSLSSMNVTRAGKWKKYLEIKRDFYLAYVRIISPNCCIYIDPLFSFLAIHPSDRSFACSFIPLFFASFIRQSVPSSVSCVNLFVLSSVSSYICSFVRQFIVLFVRSFVYYFLRLFVRSFVFLLLVPSFLGSNLTFITIGDL